MKPHYDRPLAASGLTSYRYRGQYGWIMIGARDDADALREAGRSTDQALTRDRLEVWTGAKYEPVARVHEPNEAGVVHTAIDQSADTGKPVMIPYNHDDRKELASYAYDSRNGIVDMPDYVEYRGGLEDGGEFVVRMWKSETRGVLAGAYRGKREPTYLTHLVFMDAGGSELRTGCRQPIDNIVDTFGGTRAEKVERPTCKTCANKWDKIHVARGHAGRRRMITDDELLAAVDDTMQSERMALVLPRLVRERVPWATKREFDETALRLGREGKLTLHHHDFPSSLAPEKREELVTDGRTYYAGMARRRHQANAPLARRDRGPAADRTIFFVVVGEPGEAFTMQQFLWENEESLPSDRDLDAMRSLGVGEEMSLYGGTGAETRVRRVDVEERNRRHYQFLNLTRKFEAINKRRDQALDELKRRGLPRAEYRAAEAAMLGQYDAEKDALRRAVLEPNAAYYVWVVGKSGEPLNEGPYGPHDLEAAKTFARIGATEGAHDRAVSRGRDPNASGFEIVRGYRARTGDRYI